MIAPVEPINNSGKIISSIGTVRNDNSLKFIPLYPVKFIIITIEKSITNVDIITEMIADNVFLLKPLANIKEIIEKIKRQNNNISVVMEYALDYIEGKTFEEKIKNYISEANYMNL